MSNSLKLSEIPYPKKLSIWSKINYAVVISICMFCLTFYYDLTMISLTRNMQRANTFHSIHIEYSAPETSEAIETIEQFIAGMH